MIDTKLHTYIDESIKAICPIDGISFGNINDKKTWRLHFGKSASEKQQADAQKFIDDFVWDAPKQDEIDSKMMINKYQDEPLYKKGYNDYLVKNPAASFSDYLSSLRI